MCHDARSSPSYMIGRKLLNTTTLVPRIIPRAEHTISRTEISEYALKVLYRLKNAGYQGYLVGGGVRDILLGRHPKDFDVATDATPEDLRDLFRNCRLVGRRFRLAHVHFGSDIIEVATFRGQHSGDEDEDAEVVDGRIVRDNVYGTLEEDALRRDFTINSLYYNIDDFSVVDYVGGMDDLRARQLRTIGDPAQRYREDPVRMLRAVRFAGKLDFQIEPNSEEPLRELAALLEGVPPARLFEEVLKLFLTGSAEKTFILLRRYRLFASLFPQTDEVLSLEGGPSLEFVYLALASTDQRVAEGKPVTPAFIFAALLWVPVERLKRRFVERGMMESDAFAQAADSVMAGQNQRVSLPRRFHTSMREIWHLQERFSKRAPKRSARLVEHPRFRAAYDFLALRAQAGDADKELAEWWGQFYSSDEDTRTVLVSTVASDVAEPRRRRRGRRRSNAKPTGAVAT